MSSTLANTSEHCEHQDDNQENDKEEDVEDENDTFISHHQPRNRTTTVNARILSSDYGMLFVVIIALVPLNIPCKYSRREMKQ